jgi:hypothetical protein
MEILQNGLKAKGITLPLQKFEDEKSSGSHHEKNKGNQ